MDLQKGVQAFNLANNKSFRTILLWNPYTNYNDPENQMLKQDVKTHVLTIKGNPQGPGKK